MSTLQDLNNYSVTNLPFTDNRPSTVFFSFPTARDIQQTISETTTDLQRRIDIIEIVKPAEALVEFEIDVSSVAGATVDFGTLPSGTSSSVYNQKYTVSGISSRSDWDTIVANTTITSPAGFFGSFFYICTISYFDNNIPKTKSWQVGLYRPEAEFTAVSSLECIGSQVFGSGTFNFAMQSNMQVVIIDIELVGVATISAQMTANYVSPAASVSATASIQEQGEVSPAPLSPILTIANPNSNTTDTIDNFGYNVAVDSTYILASAIRENVGSTNDAGVVYVFNKSTGAYISTLDDPSPVASAYFGEGLCITDDYFVVGAPNDTVSSDTSAGSVHFFYRTDSSYARTVTVPTADRDDFDRFGQCIARLEDNEVVVTAPGAGSPALDQYTNFIVDGDTGTITQIEVDIPQQYTAIKSNLTSSTNNLGWIVGSSQESKLYAFSGSTNIWTKAISDNSSFGVGSIGSVVTAGNTYWAASSAWDRSSDPSTYTVQGPGKIWIGRFNNGNIVTTIDNPMLGENDTDGTSTSDRLFGFGMAMNDDKLFVYSGDVMSLGPDKGRVYVFDPATGNQIAGYKMYAPDNAIDGFGSSLAWDDSSILVVGHGLQSTVDDRRNQNIYVYQIV